MDNERLIHELICPECHVQLLVTQAHLQCPHCQKIFPRQNGIPIFYDTPYVDNALAKEYVYWNEKENTPEALYENLTESAFQELLETFQISKNTRGLELGCGDGPFARRLKNKNLEVYGLDVSFPLLALTENMCPVQGNALQLPFKTLFFDWIIYGFALHHMPDPQKALQEAIRVLKNDAKIVIIDPNYYHPIRFLTRKPEMFLRRYVFTYLTPEERWIPAARVKQILKAHHVAIESVRFITPEFASPSFVGRIQHRAGKIFRFPLARMFMQSYYLVIGRKMR